MKERVYEGEFDDVKSDAGEREVPFDRRGLMVSAPDWEMESEQAPSVRSLGVLYSQGWCLGSAQFYCATSSLALTN